MRSWPRQFAVTAYAQTQTSSSAILLGRLLVGLRQDVGVDVQGEGHGGMAEPRRDDARVDATAKASVA